MMQIRSLEHTRLDTIYNVWEAAFAGYVSSWSRTEFERLLLRRGYNARLSFGAFEGNRLLSFILNGIGTYNGLPTAYDTGTGTLPAFQGQGLAGKIFQHALPALIEEGICRYLLEVLTDNEPAVQLYQKLGFQVARSFNCFRQEMRLLHSREFALNPDYQVRQVQWNPAIMKSAQQLWYFMPSWQNRFESILRQPNDFISLGIFKGEQLCAYGVIEPATGDVPQIAVQQALRRQGIGTQLLQALLQHNQCANTKVINTEVSCEALTALLSKYGYERFAQQYEMIKVLD